MILDKWDSAKTTVPFFARSPGAWWSTSKKEVLEQHVLGVLVHDVPNRNYFFTVNPTVRGDANLNIEGIRRVLLDLYPVLLLILLLLLQPLPPSLPPSLPPLSPPPLLLLPYYYYYYYYY
jgi:hypothetical protein